VSLSWIGHVHVLPLAQRHLPTVGECEMKANTGQGRHVFPGAEKKNNSLLAQKIPTARKDELFPRPRKFWPGKGEALLSSSEMERI
jgi:hypothetical protein